jgi:hypothetical protein
VLRGAQATPAGVRIGTPRARLTATYRGARCRAAAVAGTVECRLAARVRGRASETLFTLRRGTVATISVHFT